MKTHYVPIYRPDVVPPHELGKDERTFQTSTNIDEVDCDPCHDWLYEHGELSDSQREADLIRRHGSDPLRKAIYQAYGPSVLENILPELIRIDPIIKISKEEGEKLLKITKESLKYWPSRIIVDSSIQIVPKNSKWNVKDV